MSEDTHTQIITEFSVYPTGSDVLSLDRESIEFGNLRHFRTVVVWVGGDSYRVTDGFSPPTYWDADLNERSKYDPEFRYRFAPGPDGTEVDVDKFRAAVDLTLDVALATAQRLSDTRVLGRKTWQQWQDTDKDAVL